MFGSVPFAGYGQCVKPETGKNRCRHRARPHLQCCVQKKNVAVVGDGDGGKGLHTNVHTQAV